MKDPFTNYDQWKTASPDDDIRHCQCTDPTCEGCGVDALESGAGNLTDEPEPPEPLESREGYISSMADLCDYFGADEPGDLNRRIYKDTDCGASISVTLADGQEFHNGDRRFNDLRRDDPLAYFTIQTIVEGSDATVDSKPFVVPVKTAEVDAFIEYMEAEADRLWNEANDDELEGAVIGAYPHIEGEARDAGEWVISRAAGATDEDFERELAHIREHGGIVEALPQLSRRAEGGIVRQIVKDIRAQVAEVETLHKRFVAKYVGSKDPEIHFLDGRAFEFMLSMKYLAQLIESAPEFARQAGEMLLPNLRDAVTSEDPKDIQLKFGQCCINAEMLDCVCAAAWKCEKHGTKHIGTHD